MPRAGERYSLEILQHRFADVPPSRSSYAFIEDFAARGITSGCGGGNFCPDQEVTRGPMAAFLMRAVGVWERMMTAVKTWVQGEPAEAAEKQQSSDRQRARRDVVPLILELLHPRHHAGCVVQELILEGGIGRGERAMDVRIDEDHQPRPASISARS